MIYKTYNFSNIKNLVILPKSLIEKWAQNDISCSQKHGAFFLVIVDMLTNLCAKA
jgi:hypothetical protein